jgi:hypothetical protein
MPTLSTLWASPIIRRITAALLTLSAVALFLINLRRSGERVGRLTERLQSQEKTHAINREMLDSAANRPRSRDALTQRLRDGKF